MKPRKPISRTSRAKLESQVDNDDEFQYLCRSQEEWDEMERAALESECPELLPKEFWFDNWIPFKTQSPVFYETENDKKVEVVSWETGILISHIPMLITLERFFFSRLISLDLDDAVDFCILSANLVDSGSRKKFFMKLIEETGCRATDLLRKVNNEDQAYENNQYGTTNAMAYTKLDALKDYLIKSISNNGDLLPVSIEFVHANNNSYDHLNDDRQLSFKQIIDRIKVRSGELDDFKKKQILAWANMPFIMWSFKMPRGFPKDVFFRFLGKLFNVEILDQPASNINQALAQGTYHDDINDLQQLLTSYHTSFDKWQDDKLRKKQASLQRSLHQKFDSKIKRKRT
jgi:hypothetical protein